jgi:hypothetical protein
MDADLKHMRDITANYHQLQGLRLLPWFLWILALSAVNPILGLPPERLDGLCLLLPGVLVSGWLSKRIGNYYVHTFGLVNCAPRSHWHEWLTGILGAFLVCVGFFLDLTGGAPVGLVGLALAVFLPATWWMTGQLRVRYLVIAAFLAGISVLPLFVRVLLNPRWLPASLTGLVLAVFLFATWWITGRFRSHYLVMGALLAGVSLLPLFGALPGDDPYVPPIVISLTFIVGGVIDHLLLVRSLKPLPKESHDGDV